MIKGRAYKLHLTAEYQLGILAGASSILDPDNIELYSENPFDFWDEYEKHYAFCIGYQKGRIVNGN